MDPARPSSSASVLTPCKLYVFLSFRGEDTRNNFISHLFDALRRKKIEVYKDDVSLARGEEISPTLLNAIEDSKISIVVLSGNYATSRWCLEELVHILKCKRDRGHVVLPVFYGVDPSHVRKQTGSYDEAFVAHEERYGGEIEKVHDWRSALEGVGNLSGWDSREKWPESVLVEEIAQVVVLKLYNMSSTSGDELGRKFVGMEERHKKIEPLLCLDSPDVRVIGIWGMGGIGKSTLAEVVKNRFSSRFESCFFEDVSDEVKRSELRYINEKLFATLLKDRDVDMNNSFKDERLRRTKALLVLDNVNDVEQLENLIGDCEEAKSRFGEGSRVIVVSRDKKLLLESADDIYEVDALDIDEATKLFYRVAFRKDSSKIINYIDLSKKFVNYSGGNPLALKVLGSHSYLRSAKEWESTLSELELAPNEKIQKVLKISYDALGHAKQSIFLDIACFLKGEERKLVEEILGDHSHIGINVLVERCLVTITKGRVGMHDLLKEMAWEIVRRESDKLKKRSRLWVAQDVYSVLSKKGSSRVQGISLDLSQMSRDLSLSSEVFEDMENLRFLKIYNWHSDKGQRIYLHQGLQYLPDSLRYLQWSGYPLKSWPGDFERHNLVKLNMSESNLEKLWNGVEHLGNLKHITLTGSYNLLEIPDLSRTPKLESLNLSLCSSLRRFPKIPGNSLKYLSMYNSSIEEFHSSFESLEDQQQNITTLELGIPPIFPFSFGYSSQAQCFPTLLLDFHSLIRLNLGYWGLSHIPDHLGVFVSMESLNLCGNNFKNMPSSINHMLKLKILNISNCECLLSLPDLPSSIQSLNAARCVSLEKISTHGCASLRWIEASGCMSLMEIDIDKPGSSSWGELLTAAREAIVEDGNNNRSFVFSFFHCSKLEQSTRDNILTLFQREIFSLATSFHLDSEAWQVASARYPGDEIPRWFMHQNEGSSVNVTLERCHVTNFMGYAASIVLTMPLNRSAHMLSCINFVSSKLHFKTSVGSLHECHTMRCSLAFPYAVGEEFERYVFMWCLNSGPAFDVEAALGLQDEAVEALFDFEIGNEVTPLEEVKFKIEKSGIHVISLREAQEFGFTVEAREASLRKCNKPTPSLYDLCYSGEQWNCLDLDI